MRRLFDAWEAIRKGPIDIWLMLWAIAKFGKLEKTKVWRNLVGTRSLESLGTMGRLGLEGLLPFILLIAWRAAERFYAEDFSFLFNNTLLYCLCVFISLPLIFVIYFLL